MATPSMPLYDVNANKRTTSMDHTHSVEYGRAPDTFPCGHVLCHNCIRRFMRLTHRSGRAKCPVCHEAVERDIPMQAMGLATDTDETTPIALANNFDEIVKKFNGINNNLRRLKDERVNSRSMGMTFTNTQCHLCQEKHGMLRVVQEFNQLKVVHERPNAWSNYFYRLQQGKVVTEFYSRVNSSCICVPCTYKELKAVKNNPTLAALPDVNPQQSTQICLAEVGKIVAKNSAPIMALQGKNMIEIDHNIRIRERADQFNFFDTADHIHRMVRQQEDQLLRMASKQIRDTGRLYHVKESNAVELDMNETTV